MLAAAKQAATVAASRNRVHPVGTVLRNTNQSLLNVGPMIVSMEEQIIHSEDVRLKEASSMILLNGQVGVTMATEDKDKARVIPKP